MRLIDADRFEAYCYDTVEGDYHDGVRRVLEDIDNAPTVEAIPVWYIIRWYEKRYKLGSTVADDWERDLLKEKIVKMYDDFKNEKYLDNKQESERFAQMIKEIIELYNDWGKKMKMFSDCSGECCVCANGRCCRCVAGHGDDDFSPASKEQIIKNLDEGKFSSYIDYMIQYLADKFDYNYNKILGG